MLTGLENVVCGRKKSSCSLSVAEVDRHIEQLTTASEHCDLAIKVLMVNKTTFSSQPNEHFNNLQRYSILLCPFSPFDYLLTKVKKVD